MILETMGRWTGWIALHAGLAGSADIILIPELPYRLDEVGVPRARGAPALHADLRRRGCQAEGGGVTW